MSNYDPEFHEPSKDKGTPPYSAEPSPRRNGCWFYGCVFVVVSGAAALLALAVAAVVVYRTLTQYVEDYTAVAPVDLPKLEVPEPQRRSAVDRARRFRDALRARTAVEPLVLTGDDLNALVQESPKFKDRVYFTIDDDKVKARVSLPLDEFVNTSLTRGRYLNGEVELKATIQNGEAKIEVGSIAVDGKPLPENVRDLFARPSILNLDKQGGQDDLLHRIASFEIKDDEIVVKARPPGDAVEPEPESKPKPKSKSNSTSTSESESEVGPPAPKPAPVECRSRFKERRREAFI